MASLKIKKNFERKNSGMTLVEMLVAIFIFLLIMGGALFLLRQIYVRYGFAMEQGMSVNQVQHSLKIMIEEIRRMKVADSGAYPIQNADKFDLVFYGDIDHDGVTERVHYYLQNESIKKGITEPSGTPPVYPSGDQTTSVIGNYIKNSSNQPLFSYFNSSYPADQVNNPLTVPVSQINTVRMIKVDIYFNLNPLKAPDNIRLESYVEMRNMKDNW